MTTHLFQLSHANGNPVIEGNRVTFVWQRSFVELRRGLFCGEILLRPSDHEGDVEKQHSQKMQGEE